MLKPVYKDVNQFICTDLYQHSTNAPAGRMIWDKCHEIAQMLIEKNISYGNSALQPIKIFSKGDDLDGLRNRIDDKLSRIKNEQSYAGDNDVDDLIGYLILYKVGLDMNRNKEV
jgi:hypothetical protein